MSEREQNKRVGIFLTRGFFACYRIAVNFFLCRYALTIEKEVGYFLLADVLRNILYLVLLELVIYDGVIGCFS